MKRPKNLTIQNYWESNTSDERSEIIANAFKYIDYLESDEYKKKIIDDWVNKVEDFHEK